MKESIARVNSAVKTLVAFLLKAEAADHFEKRVLLNEIRRARADLQEAERICQQEIAGG